MTTPTAPVGDGAPYRVARAGEWISVILTEFNDTVEEGIQLDADQRPAIGGTKWLPEG